MVELRNSTPIIAVCGWLFYTSSGCSANGLEGAPRIVIDNAIEDCFRIELNKELIRNNVILLDSKLKKEKSTGYCGCKSTNLSYFVTITSPEGIKKNTVPNVFSSLLPVDYTFVIDQAYTGDVNTKYKLNIQCASPN